MANQVIVTNTGNVQVALTPPANVQVQISRAAIGTVSNVPTANYANYAGNVTGANQPNITSLGTLTALNVSGNGTVNNLTVTGNLSVGNLFANNANYSNFAGTAFNVSGSNVTGAVANATYANAANTANLATYATTANSVAGANVSGIVANANYSAYANIAATANSVAVANVSGIGNIAVINLDGNASNILFGNGTFGPESGNLNANYANFAGQVVDNTQSNITSVGTLSNLTVSGNVSAPTVYSQGMVTQGYDFVQMQYSNGVALPVSPYDIGTGSWFYLDAGGATWQSNTTGTFKEVILANDGGISASGNITGANANLGNLVTANYFSGDGSLLSNINGGNVSNVANANYANFAGTAYSVDVANVVGIGNIAVINLDGNVSNILHGDGSFGPEAGNLSANYANFAGQVVDNTQSNITALGTLSNLSVTGNIETSNNVTALKYYAATGGDEFSGYGFVGASNSNTAMCMTATDEITIYNNALETLSLYANNNAKFYANLTANYYFGDGSQLSNINGGNVSNVANANYANFAGTAFSVSGSNVSGEVANANYASYANLASTANLATFATTANAVAGANVSGEVANANYSAYANIAASANSVALANVSGIGNIANINLTGSSSNVLFGNGVFAPESTSIANANYANFAGTVITNAQPNITSVGNLPYLQVSNSANATGVINQIGSNNITFATNFSDVGTNQLTTIYHPNNSTGYPAERIVRSRGNVTNPTTAVAVDRIYQQASYAYNGITNVVASTTTTSLTGTVNANANAAWTGAQWSVGTGNPAGDVANATALSPTNALTFSNSGALFISPGTPANASLGQTGASMLITSYGASTAALAQAGGLVFQRARGNRDSLSNVAVGDQIYRILGYGYSNGAYQSANVAQYNVLVDSGYVANDVIIPMSHVFQTVANVANVSTFRTTRFYSNGTTALPGNINFTASTANLLTASNGQISLGVDAGTTSQGSSAVAIGLRAANVSQGQQGVAVGYQAGSNTQGQYSVAVGGGAGQTTQGNSAVAVGQNAGQTSQGQYAVAIGSGTGLTSQGQGSVAVGQNAGQTSQGSGGVAVGSGAGSTSQSSSTVAVGENAGSNTQGSIAVAVGQNAGSNTQGQFSVAIGSSAGQTTQGERAVAIGPNAGQTSQGNYTVAIGLNAGYNTQGTQSVSLGYYAGANSQGQYSVAIGRQAGEFTQGSNSFALGYAAASNNQGNNSIAFGWAAGLNTQGNNAIAIGARAGDTNQANNSIILNATGVPLDQTTANTFTVKPVRNIVTGNVVFYNNTSGEISYDTLANNTSNISAANVTINSNGFVKLASYTASALTAITGQIGWMAAVSDSGGGGNPNGMIAFWDTTHTRWSYIHDNSAV